MGANMVVASKSDTMQACMSKMVARDIRHLPVVDEDTGTVSTHLLNINRLPSIPSNAAPKTCVGVLFPSVLLNFFGLGRSFEEAISFSKKWERCVLQVASESDNLHLLISMTVAKSAGKPPPVPTPVRVVWVEATAGSPPSCGTLCSSLSRSRSLVATVGFAKGEEVTGCLARLL